MDQSTIKYSSTEKVSIAQQVAFGDVGDLFTEDKIISEGGTIRYTIDVNRDFIPGDYQLHIIEVETDYCVAIICHDEVDPMKLHQLLKRSNTGKDFRCPNYVSRYDWMHYRNWGGNPEFVSENKKCLNRLLTVLCGVDRRIGSDSEGDQSGESSSEWEDVDSEFEWEEVGFCDDHLRKFLFFVDAAEREVIRNGKFTVKKSGNQWVSFMYKEVQNEKDKIIGLILHIDSMFITGDWHYGCVLADEGSQKYFALVFEEYYTYRYKDGECTPPTVDIVGSNYTLPMHSFKK